jgi:ADP-ribose pyrophosphatase YjhB (NUDIX family)
MLTDRQPLCGVGVAIVNEGKLLLVQRMNPPNQGMWAVPGGKVALGETMRNAARREVHEETGLEVEIGDVVWAGDSIGLGDPPEWHYCLVDFLGSIVGGELRAGDDAAAVRWVPLTEVKSLPLTPTMSSLLETIAQKS